MARFRAPSATPSGSQVLQSRSLAEATLRPRQAGKEDIANKTTGKGKGKAKDKGKGRARTPLPMNAARKEKLKMSMKKRKVLPVNLRPREWCYLYVGNLTRSHSEEVLKTFFEKSGCGEVFQVIIRVTAGVPAASHSSIPSSPLDRMYASVELTDVFSLYKALALDGAFLLGTRIKVCLTPDELPEIQDLVTKHIRNKVEPDDRTLVTRAVQALKRITVQRTLASPNVAGPSRTSRRTPGPSNSHQAGPSRVPHEAAVANKTRLMGMSFAKTIV